MLKLKSVIISVVALLLVAMPAVADNGNAGCKDGKFVGSYTTAQTNQDVFGDGHFIHTWILQLTLHSDGTADQNYTAGPEFPINTGSQGPWIGSWTCRQDGKLVVTLLRAFYNPIGPTPPDTTYADIELGGYNRFTFLFSVTDINTLTRINRRIRTYGANDDPTDPGGGTLGPLQTNQVIYNRVVASDDDLLAP
jgi:hypothetical protein